MEQIGISKLDLKRQNRMHILKLIKQKGAISRIDIAAQLELTRAAVTIISGEMINQGILMEVGGVVSTEKATRGRKKILLNINHSFKLTFGVSIETKNVSIGLCTLDGQVLDKYNCDTNELDTPKKIYDFINNSITDMMKVNCLDENSVLGMGIAIMPDMYSKLGVKFVEGNVDYSIPLSNIAAFTDMHVVVDNMIKGLAMANIDFCKQPHAMSRQNVGLLHVGDSFNYILINLTDPIISYDNRTGFVDNMILNPYSDTPYDRLARRGSAVVELSKEAFLSKIKAIYGKESTPSLYYATNGDADLLTIAKVTVAVREGDKKVLAVYRQINELLAVLINNLIFSTNPHQIVLHGDNMSERYLIDLKNTIDRISGPDVSNRVLASNVDSNSHFLAGVAIAVRELFYVRGGM